MHEFLNCKYSNFNLLFSDHWILVLTLILIIRLLILSFDAGNLSNLRGRTLQKFVIWWWVIINYNYKQFKIIINYYILSSSNLIKYAYTTKAPCLFCEGLLIAIVCNFGFFQFLIIFVANVFKNEQFVMNSH